MDLGRQTHHSLTENLGRAAPSVSNLHLKRIIGTQKGLNALRILGLVSGLALIIAAFEIQRGQFLSLTNLLTILRSMASLGMIAFAEMLVILVGEIDLSIGAAYGLTPVAAAAAWLGGGSLGIHLALLPALAFGIGLALFVGLLNGFLVVRAGIPSFIATLGTLNVAQGLQLLIDNAATFTPQFNEPRPPGWELTLFKALGGETLPFGIPAETLWLVVSFGVFWFVRHRTVFGFRLVAIGGNPYAAATARLPVERYKFLVLLLCSFMSGLAGLADFSYVGSVGPTDAGALLFSAIAAVIIGGASLSGGRGTVVGTLLGVALLSVLNNGLALLGVGSYAQLLFIGAITVLAVWIDIVSQRLIRRAGHRAASRQSGEIK